jgi:hypothetical protein
MTKTEKVTKNGGVGIRITCMCGGHDSDKASAVIVGAAADAIDARTGKDRDERIHGFVSMANHPARMIRIASERKGVFGAEVASAA